MSMKLFKQINPRFYKNDKKFFKSVNVLRSGIYEQLESQDYAGGLNFINKDERVINIMNLGQLVQRVLRKYDLPKEYEHTEFRPKMPSSDVLYNLIGRRGNSIEIRDLNNMDLILNQYDYIFMNPRFYFNTLGQGPLRTYQVQDMTIIFRGYNELSLDRFLRNVSLDLGEYFSFSEPYFIGYLSSFRLKEEIILRYCRHSFSFFGLKEYEYQKIIEDAYSDLRRISSIFCDSEVQEREKFLESIRLPFSDNLEVCLTKRYYVPYVSEKEMERYTQLIKEFVKGFNRIVQCIRGNAKEYPFNIKQYYVFDQDIRKCNKLKISYEYVKNQVMEKLVYNKVVRSIITQVHPDVVTGIFCLMRHLDIAGLSRMYYQASPLCQLISLLLSNGLRLKPLVIKLGFKNICDNLLHDMKELGLITCHQLENFFGYRVGITILEEVKDDYMNWFTKGIEQYNDIQYNFIKKWAMSFFKSLNFKGRILGEIISENLSHYPSFDSILGHEYQYLTGHGVIGDKLVDVVGGKKRSISKNLYYKLFKDPNDEDETSKRNKVIIKREELIKQRIVINSTLRTFKPLAKINKFLSVALANTGIVYVFNNKGQKADNYVRLNNYLLYNKVLRKRYLCLPLDYSSYDHTITMGFIQAVIESIGEYTGYIEELKPLFEEFRALLEDEVIYFKELEKSGDNRNNNQKYKYGMLSGWKITSSVESIGNAILSYGVMSELGLNLVDLETMGDDLIIILEAEGLSREDQLKLLTLVCGTYEKLGFEMNVPKNSVGYYFLEFLRVTFRPGSVQCYPTRILGSIVYLKPGKEEENFSIIEVQSVLRKICKRYGCNSRYVEIASYFLPSFQRGDISRFGVAYIKNQGLFSLKRVEKIKYEYKVNIRDSPVFHFYSEILGHEYEDEIENVVSRYMARKTVTLTIIEPRGLNRGYSENEIRYLEYVVRMYRKRVDRVLNLQKLYIPDYHLGILIARILKRLRNQGVEVLRAFLLRVNTSVYRAKLIREVDHRQNISVINSIIGIRDAIDRLETDKVLVDESNIPSLIFSKIKKDFIVFLRDMLNRKSLSDFGVSVIRSILRKNKNYVVRNVLSDLLAAKSEVLGAFDGMPIGWMCD